MTHEQLSESAAGYALGVLDADEQHEFELHLQTCARCQAEVKNHREAVGMMAQVVKPMRPRDPEALRARILEQARAVRPIASAPTTRRRFYAAPIAAAACVVLAGVLGVLYQREHSRTVAMQELLATTRGQLAARDSALAAFIGPEVHVVSLTAGGAVAKPAMRVFWNHTRNVFVVTAQSLPAPPAGKTYQLWAITKGKAPASMGTFAPAANGQATTILPVSAEIAQSGFIDDCALTLEPAGGSTQPTETPRLLGTWRHVD